MSNAPRFSDLNLSRSRFRDHPDSIAEPLRRRRLEWLAARLRDRRIAPYRPESAEAPARGNVTLDGCPFTTSWRQWDMFGPEDYRRLSSDERRVCAGARRLLPLAHRGLLQLDWAVARDDASHQPMTSSESGQPGWKFSKGSPRHVHAETVLDGHRVHIDVLSATKHGPGRSYQECRIFVDGRLAGRGGDCGCSLGFGTSDLPAVAAVDMDAAMTFDSIGGYPVVEFWKAHLIGVG